MDSHKVPSSFYGSDTSIAGLRVGTSLAETMYAHGKQAATKKTNEAPFEEEIMHRSIQFDESRVGLPLEMRMDQLVRKSDR